MVTAERERTVRAMVARPVVAWWRSRFGARLLVEIAVCGGLLTAYREIRTVNKPDLTAAFANALHVIRFEQMLGLRFEDDIQRWVLSSLAIVKFLNHYYVWLHFPAAIAVLVWLYLFAPERYPNYRNLMAVVTFGGLILHLTFPLAPPRMIPGFVDTMNEFGPQIYSPNVFDGVANQIAAMPSLHFGWALIEAIAVIRVLRTRWRWLALLHPTVMIIAIIGTANHWWLDAAVAAALISAAIIAWHAVVEPVRRRRAAGVSGPSAAHDGVLVGQ